MKTIYILLFSTCFTFAVPQPVEERYTTLRTIAGRGQNQSKNNSWLAAFEGADPLHVELSRPHDCGTDALGRVYIADKDSNGILRVSADGSEIRTVAGTHSHASPLPQSPDAPTPATEVNLNDPNGLHVFADGSFLILDLGNRKVRKVDSAGMCSTLFSYSPGFITGRGLVASPDGQQVYFCGEAAIGGNQRVKRWNAATNDFDTLAELPTGLGNMDLAPDGSLIVTSRTAHEVYRVREGEDPERIAGTGFATGNTVSGSPATTVALDEVRGVAILPDGSYFLATHKGGDIWWVDLEGNAHLFIQGRGEDNVNTGDGLNRTTPGDKISEPRSIHYATNGDLLITTNDTGFIRAVRNIHEHMVPEAQLSQELELSWDAVEWRETFLIESSATLLPDSWTPAGAITSQAPGELQTPLPSGGPRKFWRISRPQNAGGQ